MNQLTAWLQEPGSRPIVQAPMAGAQDHRLAIAVSQAGALGSLPCAMLATEALQASLRELQAMQRPYNVNLFCHAPPTPDEAREAAWRRTLAPYYRELGVEPPAATSTASRAPFSADVADLVEPFAPPVVSFHFGLPSDDLRARVRGWGSAIVGCATTLDEARWLAARGVDAIVAQGIEAGGHRGIFLDPDLSTQRPTLELVRAIVAELDTPVIAAGGIATAKDVRAALDAGAIAAQVGSAYLSCPEATTSAVHRAALASAASTAITHLFSGRPARGLVNRLMRDLGAMGAAPPAFPLASSAIAPLRAAAEALGRDDFSPLWCGTARRTHALDAAQLTRDLARLA